MRWLGLSRLRCCVWHVQTVADKEGRNVLLQLSSGRCVSLASEQSGSSTVGME